MGACVKDDGAVALVRCDALQGGSSMYSKVAFGVSGGVAAPGQSRDRPLEQYRGVDNQGRSRNVDDGAAVDHPTRISVW